MDNATCFWSFVPQGIVIHCPRQALELPETTGTSRDPQTMTLMYCMTLTSYDLHLTVTDLSYNGLQHMSLYGIYSVRPTAGQLRQALHSVLKPRSSRTGLQGDLSRQSGLLRLTLGWVWRFPCLLLQ
jgi:hypothetical protein